jgi:CRP-like cAMP-binding protein
VSFSSCIFKSLSPEEISILINSKSNRTYKKNQIIYLEGEKPQGIYCIASGKVKITQTNKDGREQIVRILKEGDNIGYHAIFTKENYTDSAVVLEEAEICYIPKQEFLKIHICNSAIAEDILIRLAKDFNEIETLIKQLAFKPVRERMAEAFLLLKKAYNHSDDSELNITISRGDLASLAGTAKETVARLLSEFKEDKIISIEGKGIRIKDWKKIQKISHMYD